MRLSVDVIARLRAHAEAAYPEECVGALVRTASGEVVARPLHNVAADPRRGFALGAREYVALESQADATGHEVVGFYHSHPDAEAVPSARDAEAAWARWWTVIVPVSAKGAGAPRVWQFDEVRRGFSEVGG